MARLSMRAVSGAMFRWKEFVEETKHMRGLLQRASMALTKRCMVNAFAIWKEKMDEAAEELAAAQRVIGRVKYGAAWAKWREKVADAREHRELMHKAANFIVNRTKSSSFYTWRDNAETMADMRAKVAGFVAARRQQRDVGGVGEVAKLPGRPGGGARRRRARDALVGQQGDALGVRAVVRGAGGARAARRRCASSRTGKSPSRLSVGASGRRISASTRRRCAPRALHQRALSTAFTRWLDFCEDCETTTRALSYVTVAHCSARCRRGPSACSRLARRRRARTRRCASCSRARCAVRSRAGRSSRWSRRSARGPHARGCAVRRSRCAKALFAAFAHWRGLARDARRGDGDSAGGFGRRSHNRAKASAFERWAEALEDLRRRRRWWALLYKVLFRALRARSSDGRTSPSRKPSSAQDGEGLARLKNRVTSGAFSTWRSEVELILEDRAAAAAKAVGHFFQSAVRVAWRGSGRRRGAPPRDSKRRSSPPGRCVLFAMNVQGGSSRAGGAKPPRSSPRPREKLAAPCGVRAVARLSLTAFGRGGMARGSRSRCARSSTSPCGACRRLRARRRVRPLGARWLDESSRSRRRRRRWRA